MPKAEIYPNKIIEAERNGVKILPVTVESVRKHREHLEEAGVLTGYSYHGPNRPVKIAFNASILSVTDNGSPKIPLLRVSYLRDHKRTKFRITMYLVETLLISFSIGGRRFAKRQIIIQLYQRNYKNTQKARWKINRYG